MKISAEDAVVRLRAEVLATDWQLSSTRSSYLQEAFTTLSRLLQHRSHCRAVLAMASNVLAYINTCPSDNGKAMDFLKEAMAHIITMYEDDTPSEEEDKEHVLSLWQHYKQLRHLLKSDPDKK